MPANTLAGQGGAWSPSAIHDSTAAVARGSAYDRSIAESLWTTFWRWLNDAIDAFLDHFRGSGPGRWVTISLLALLVLLVVARTYMAARAARESAARGASGGRRANATEHPWLDAQRFAAAGMFTEAAHALFAALLAAFAERGDVRLHSSKTAGDYARELGRRGSPAHPRFESFRQRYDVAVYGRGQVTSAEYAGLLEDATPIIDGPRAA